MSVGNVKIIESRDYCDTPFVAQKYKPMDDIDKCGDRFTDDASGKMTIVELPNGKTVIVLKLDLLGTPYDYREDIFSLTPNPAKGEGTYTIQLHSCYTKKHWFTADEKVCDSKVTQESTLPQKDLYSVHHHLPLGKLLNTLNGLLRHTAFDWSNYLSAYTFYLKLVSNPVIQPPRSL